MKFISALFFICCLMLAMDARAEYYIECPTCVTAYDYPKYHHYPHRSHQVKHRSVKHHKKVVHHHPRRHSSCHISVYYVSPCGTCPFVCIDRRPPNCGQYMSSSTKHRLSHDYVTFSYAPVPYPRYREEDDYVETYDMRTADDDVMRYPDMNNQY
jgi:hypothetical protein